MNPLQEGEVVSRMASTAPERPQIKLQFLPLMGFLMHNVGGLPGPAGSEADDEREFPA